MTKQMRLLSWLLLCTFFLSGCTSGQSFSPAVTLPPPAPGPEAPIGDAGLRQDAIVPLYLPSADGQSLLTVFETLSLSSVIHPAEEILHALLNHPGNSRVRALGRSTTLTLAGANPVEISGDVCTVNLSANALQLSSEDLYTVALAITATLCELSDVSYVNLLIAGAPIAMDVGGYLPLGALNASVNQELPVLWKQLSSRRTPVGELPAHTPLTSTATLYFPLTDGCGIAAEPRRISFPGQHPQQLVVALLSALSAGANVLKNAAELPDLSSLMLFVPEVTALESGGQRVTLHFTADVKERLITAGCDPACVFAAITVTLTTFVPSLQQVCILIGDGALTSLYNPNLGSMLFPGGLMTRASFGHALMRQIPVFVPLGQSLASKVLTLPYRVAANPRSLLLAMADPSVGTLPQELTDADILGLSVQDGTLLVHFSARFADILRASDQDQRLMAYSIVNTLCERLNIRRVRFCFGGETLDSLGSETSWSGEFLYNPALITH